jgi:hypothetical protein
VKALSRGQGILGHTPQQGLFDEDVIFETEDHVIGGTMITVKIEHDDLAHMKMDDEQWRIHIRHKLANQLALVMLESQLMETTSMQDPQGRLIIAARCYLAPNQQVKVLRVHKR